MGNSNDTRKNVLVRLGIILAAGVLIAGVCRAAVTPAGSKSPSWLGRVDIRVGNGDKETETETETAEESGTYEESGTIETQTADAEKRQEEEIKETGTEPVKAVQAHAAAQDGVVSAVITDVSEVVREAMPCVVSIVNEYTAHDYWNGEEYDDKANGSGIIVAQNDTELMIVTNYHVVEKNKNLYVQFADDARASAYVKGQSPDNDIAIVSVFLEDMADDTLANISIATLGDSDSLRLGEPAIAIGDPLGYGQSVTTGVISALNRDISISDDGSGAPDGDGEKHSYLIQTDAAINPGNSGGALLNVKGEVIGINSSKIADYVIEGMGYAIPISTAKPIMEELMAKETRRKVPEDKRAFLGVSGTEVTQEAADRYKMPQGVYVTHVFKDTAAGKAGLLKGDIIVSIDGEKLTGMEQLQGLLEFYAAGTKAGVTVMRQAGGEYGQRTVMVTLEAKEE